MSYPRYTKLIDSLPATVPFVGPEAQERERGAVFLARLGANESVFGPSPNAIQAMRDAAAEIWQYGDPTSHALSPPTTTATTTPYRPHVIRHPIVSKR